VQGEVEAWRGRSLYSWILLLAQDVCHKYKSIKIATYE
jgi:hypothetical protein